MTPKVTLAPYAIFHPTAIGCVILSIAYVVVIIEAPSGRKAADDETREPAASVPPYLTTIERTESTGLDWTGKALDERRIVTCISRTRTRMVVTRNLSATLTGSRLQRVLTFCLISRAMLA